MTVDDVNLRHFLALSDIAESGRLSTAADALFVSQSALTQALRKLEDAAGMPLFERAGFGMSETDAGRLLVRRARRSIDLLRQAEQELRRRLRSATPPVPAHRRLTSSQLRALVAVVETGGYSAAARKLGLAQPTVHRATKDLEAVFGVRLFRRTARGVEPGELAILLARHARLVFAEIRQGFEEIGDLAGRSDSRIAVGSLPLARSEFLPAAVTRLLAQFPDARVTILDGPYMEQLHALRHGDIDWLIGALRDPVPFGDVSQEALFDQPLAVVVRPGHPALQDRRVDARALARLEWIAPRPPAPARQLFSAFFRRAGIAEPRHVIECGSLIATRGLVQRSDRAALLSPLQFRPYVDSGQLAILLESIPLTERSIGISMRDNWEPTRVQAAFTTILRDLATDFSERRPAARA